MITINGKTYKGNNIVVSGDCVYIDGKKMEGDDSKEININVVGDLGSIKVDNCNKLEVRGNCSSVESKNGDVIVGGYVSGDVVSKNGNISCGNVAGNVETKNGNIKRR